MVDRSGLKSYSIWYLYHPKWSAGCRVTAILWLGCGEQTPPDPCYSGLMSFWLPCTQGEGTQGLLRGASLGAAQQMVSRAAPASWFQSRYAPGWRRHGSGEGSAIGKNVGLCMPITSGVHGSLADGGVSLVRRKHYLESHGVTPGGSPRETLG
jgi:hypothetical protein